MKSIRTVLSELDGFDKLENSLSGKAALVKISEISDSVRPHLIEAAAKPYPIRVIITYSEIRAKQICEDLLFYDQNAMFFPAKDLIFYHADIRSGEITRQRLKCIRNITTSKHLTVVTCFSTLMTPQISPDTIRKAVVRITDKSLVDEKELALRLSFLGYERVAQVEAPGQFAIRGDIVDVFDITQENPVRIELWGDDVDSIRIFDVSTQRSIERLESVEIFPATELLISEEKLNAGFKRIKEEARERTDILKKELRTEQAHRLSEHINTITEQVLELKMHINLESFIRYFVDEPGSLMDFFPEKKTCFFFDEPERILEHAAAVENEFIESMSHRIEGGYILPGQADILFGREKLFAAFSSRRKLVFESLETKALSEMFPADAADEFRIRAHSIAPYNNSFPQLVKDLKKYKKSGYRVLILSGSRSRAKRLVEDLRDNDVSAFYSEDPNRTIEQGEIETYYGNITKGFECPELKFALISESDIFNSAATKKKRRKKNKYKGEEISGFADLKVGDYVVHEEHGLGIYRGVDQIEVDKTVRDYLRIEYAGGGSLYIAATGLSVIQKYASASDENAKRRPKLNKLGGSEWAKTKAKVQTAVEEVARDLVELYARRSREKGHSFEKDTVWQQEFEEAFPYEETEDQQNAIEEMKRDMESDNIMDRLICGDVGFGKTEIAIRGAFKAVQEGKQVALLVPTTILAQQHFNTFTERFKNFPVKVDMLSRFRTASEIKRSIKELESGMTDIIIGTHRLLSKDVKFKDLGLLVIDEEQRFGVSHKEKIKKMRESVDVLTLTATPIPRTLHMSLIGIRSVSMLEEPPLDRLPIQTFVCEYNEEMVREAVMRELSRKGQTYYVYNRVNTIADVAAKLQRLVPEARIGFAHGQMSESELEKIMYEFVGGEIDVLVSTTIIETGMDIPNVNTIIIEDSDKMGLSQLYQLRGRVGRSKRTSYAFLMYKRDRILQEVAQKRLDAIREFTDLGSGHRIAMRDLEIRGAGNLLGTRQSGHMAEVGYEMYVNMLEEAISKFKGEGGGEKSQRSVVTTVDLNIDAHIPDSYIMNEEQKLEIYKRIAAFTSFEEGEEMRDELKDRFGSVPESVENLIRVSCMRMRAGRLFITDIKNDSSHISMKLKPDAPLDPGYLPDLINSYRGRLKFHSGTKPEFVYSWRQIPGTSRSSEELMKDTDMLLSDMETAFIEKRPPEIHKNLNKKPPSGTAASAKAVIKLR